MEIEGGKVCESVEENGLPLDPRWKMDRWREWMEREGDLLEELVGRTLEGMSPREIALELGLPRVRLVRWIEESDERREAVLAARRGYATELMYVGLQDVEGAVPETVGLAKLRAEHRTKVAGKFDRGAYGEAAAAGVSVTVGVMPSEGEIVGRLVEMARDTGFVRSLPGELRAALAGVAGLTPEETGDAEQISEASAIDAGGGAWLEAQGSGEAAGSGGNGEGVRAGGRRDAPKGSATEGSEDEGLI